MKDDPSLHGKPMAVGGMAMLSTANYEARCVALTGSRWGG
jgi:nucleotidyltransferase/DNA polymerase involved in DNA repair